MTDLRVAADIVSIVGESPIWAAREQALYWIDGQQRQMHRLDPTSGAVTTYELPYRPSCLEFTNPVHCGFRSAVTTKGRTMV